MHATGADANGASTTPTSACRRSRRSSAYSGLEFLQRIADGEPAATADSRRLASVLAEVAPGFALFTMTHSQALQPDRHRAWRRRRDPARQLHELRVQTHLDQGIGYITLELKVNFVRPSPSKPARSARKAARSTWAGVRGPPRARSLDAKGTLLAHGTTTCLIFPL